MMYKNYMEEAVKCELEEIKKQLDDVCLCERCEEDIIAYALNRLPSKYVVTDMGRTYTKLNQLKVQSKTDVTVAIMDAIRAVRSNPRH